MTTEELIVGFFVLLAHALPIYCLYLYGKLFQIALGPAKKDQRPAP